MANTPLRIWSYDDAAFNRAGQSTITTLVGNVAAAGSVSIGNSGSGEPVRLKVAKLTTVVESASFDGFTTTGAYTNLAAATSFTSFRYRATSLPVAAEEIATIVSGTAVPKMSCRLDQNGNLSLFAADGTTQLGSTGTTVLATFADYRIDLKCGNGTNAAYELRICPWGGTPASELSGTGNVAATNTSRVILGQITDRNGKSFTGFYDQLWIDSADYAPTGYNILAIPAAANGGTQSWTGGTNTSDWTQVSNGFITSTYVADPTGTSLPVLGQFTIASFATHGFPNASSITAVSVFCYASDGGSATNTFSFGLISGGTSSLTSTLNTGGTGSPNELGKLYTTDPNTSAAWTQSAVEAVTLEVSEGTTSVTTRCYGICLIVAYVPAPDIDGFFSFFG